MRHRSLLVLALGVCCLGMARKPAVVTIRFYTQTMQQDSQAFSAPLTLLNGRQTYVEEIAAISEHDIVGIYPFAAGDGSAGCAFKLDDHGTIALETLSVARKGTILIAAVNGRQVADILIDQRVPDGIVTIPNGINGDELKVMLNQFPMLGGKKLPKAAAIIRMN